MKKTKAVVLDAFHCSIRQRAKILAVFTMASRPPFDSDGIGYCKGARTEKMAQLNNRQQQVKPAEIVKRQNTDIAERKSQLEHAMTKDTFVKDIKKMDKTDPDYGKPQEGTLTAERGKKALTHVHKEILYLCEVIYMHGMEQHDHTAVILFGDLFKIYTRISDKVVGILLRARKYGLVYFEPEILYQGRDDDEPVFLARPMQQIYFEYNENKGFVAAANKR